MALHNSPYSQTNIALRVNKPSRLLLLQSSATSKACDETAINAFMINSNQKMNGQQFVNLSQNSNWFRLHIG